MSAGMIIGVVILFIILLYVLSWLFSTGRTLSNLADAKTAVVIPSTSLKNGGSTNYAYSIWIYVDDWAYRYGQEKIIFLRGAIGSIFTPALSLMPNDNTAVITMTTASEPFECTEYSPTKMDQYHCYLE